MIFVDGPAGNGIAESVAEKLGAKSAKCSSRIFPDGESEVGIGADVKGQDVWIVQTMYPQQDKRLVELLFLAEEARGLGASSVGAIVPYLAYARQDKRFEGKDNAVSISAVLKLMNSAGITSLITAAPHKNASLSEFKGSIAVADAVTPLANEVKASVSAPFVLAPDKGASGLAESFAKVLGCDFASLDKERDLQGHVNIVNAPDLDIAGKEVIIVDDMISAGGTMVKAAKFAHAPGVKRVVAAAVHLLMVGSADSLLKGAGISELYGTNSIPYSGAHTVDISGAIADAVKGSVDHAQ